MSFSSEEVMASIKKNPISVGSALLTVALLVVTYLHSGRGAELETELEEKSAEAAKLASNLKNAAQLKEQFDALLVAKTAIEARMIRAEDLPTNQQYFYKLEADSGVKLLDIRQSTGSRKDAKGAYQPTAFSLNVQGDYRQLLTFLRRLESGSRYCRVLTTSCTTPSDRGPVLVMSVNLELLGFP
jgi:Tfp pilus assembly protein PilO